MQRAATPVSIYTIDALIAEGFSRHMIRKYITWGVLPRANGRGAHAYYDARHIRILREIQRSKDERRTIADILDWVKMEYPHRAV